MYKKKLIVDKLLETDGNKTLENIIYISLQLVKNFSKQQCDEN